MTLHTDVLVTNPASPYLPGILAHPGIHGLSLAVPWLAVERSLGLYDFSKLDAGLRLARAADKQFAPRIRGGASTPVFRMGRTYVPASGVPAGKTIPCPVEVSGKPNATWLNGFRSLVAALGAWVKANLEPGDGPVHLTHFGGASAEIYVSDQLMTLQGATPATIAAAHIAVLRSGAAMQTSLPVEFSISGLEAGPLLKDLQAAIVAEMRLINKTRPILDQRNGFSDGAGSGAWPEGTNPPHGLQMVKAFRPDGTSFDWIGIVYPKAIVSGAVYLEVYDTSFTGPGAQDLISACAAAA